MTPYHISPIVAWGCCFGACEGGEEWDGTLRHSSAQPQPASCSYILRARKMTALLYLNLTAACFWAASASKQSTRSSFPSTQRLR